MTVWPREISDDEAIVRGICSPYHVDRNGKLRPDAYRSPPGKDEVSVMRLAWIGADASRQHAKQLANPVQHKVYKGLAVLSAAQIRKQHASVVDTREVFDGHADITFGITPVKGEPLPPQLQLALKALADLAMYYPDAAPDADRWVGPPLRYRI